MTSSFEDLLSETVKQHPLTEFQEFTDLEKGNEYMAQFADLVNTLSTKVVIPVSTTDELSDFADLAGVRVFGQMDGDDGIMYSDPSVDGVKRLSGDVLNEKISQLEQQMNEEISGGGSTFVSDTAPNDPSAGDEWVDSSYKRAEKKVYVNDEVGWQKLIGGSNLPPSEKLEANNVEGGEKVLDVSEVDKSVYFTIASGSGGDNKYTSVTTVDRQTLEEDMEETYNHYHGFEEILGIEKRNLVSSSGKGAVAKIRIDLSQYNELKVEPAVRGENGSQYNATNYGGAHQTNAKSAKGGDGVRITDRYDNPIAYASGGGGGAAHAAWECSVSQEQGSNDRIFLRSPQHGGNGALYGIDGSNQGGRATRYTGWGHVRAEITNAADGSVKSPGNGVTVVNSSSRSIMDNTYVETFTESKR